MSLQYVLLPIILCIVAGFINGSYVTPSKWMKGWNDEVVWLSYTLFGFILLPVLSVFALDPEIFTQISQVPRHYIELVLVGGVLWGISQLFFVLALKRTGLAVSFVVNISMGTAGGALLPLLWNQSLLGTKYAYLQLLGAVIFVVAVITTILAGEARRACQETHQENSQANSSVLYMILGVFFAILSGLGSIIQGNSYTYANPTLSHAAIENGATLLPANTIAFTLIFVGAFLPNVIYFACLAYRRKSLSSLLQKGAATNWFYALLMGVGAWGSVLLFCQAQALIGGALAPTIAWPLFMIFIVLTANFWSFVHGEWKGAGAKAKKLITSSLVLFIAAVIVFGVNSINKPDQHAVVAKTSSAGQVTQQTS
ncbi:hypothetical protein M9194_05790 [Vibrio sp. S4M6]|uniref:L-rhamnose/proton symporter RhaT n=1 Tax=Vibrio sinus TaxID=2946865 RepID=UPI00202A24CB|nr:L-rhamnose/proton symporter RhaT [Vibrio sinus]MCL9780942.1 hypothetical protein [Vibrio sinus]